VLPDHAETVAAVEDSALSGILRRTPHALVGASGEPRARDPEGEEPAAADVLGRGERGGRDCVGDLKLGQWRTSIGTQKWLNSHRAFCALCSLVDDAGNRGFGVVSEVIEAARQMNDVRDLRPANRGHHL
jgi:hypothetical protein